MKINIQKKRGANLVYVVVLITILAIMGLGYTAIVTYNTNSVIQQEKYQAERYYVRNTLDALVQKLGSASSWNEGPLIIRNQFDTPSAAGNLSGGARVTKELNPKYAATGSMPSIFKDGTFTIKVVYYPATPNLTNLSGDAKEKAVRAAMQNDSMDIYLFYQSPTLVENLGVRMKVLQVSKTKTMDTAYTITWTPSYYFTPPGSSSS